MLSFLLDAGRSMLEFVSGCRCTCNARAAYGFSGVSRRSYRPKTIRFVWGIGPVHVVQCLYLFWGFWSSSTCSLLSRAGPLWGAAGARRNGRLRGRRVGVYWPGTVAIRAPHVRRERARLHQEGRGPHARVRRERGHLPRHARSRHTRRRCPLLTLRLCQPSASTSLGSKTTLVIADSNTYFT